MQRHFSVPRVICSDIPRESESRLKLIRLASAWTEQFTDWVLLRMKVVWTRLMKLGAHCSDQHLEAPLLCAERRFRTSVRVTTGVRACTLYQDQSFGHV
jgi:hypothetical protein